MELFRPMGRPSPLFICACHVNGVNTASPALRRPPVVLLGGLNLARTLGMAGIPCIVATGDAQSLAVASRYCHGRVTLPVRQGTDAVVETLRRAGAKLARVFGRVPLFYSNDQQLALVQQPRQ